MFFTVTVTHKNLTSTDIVFVFLEFHRCSMPEILHSNVVAIHTARDLGNCDVLQPNVQVTFLHTHTSSAPRRCGSPPAASGGLRWPVGMRETGCTVCGVWGDCGS